MSPGIDPAEGQLFNIIRLPRYTQQTRTHVIHLISKGTQFQGSMHTMTTDDLLEYWAGHEIPEEQIKKIPVGAVIESVNDLKEL